jgi:hypothetical protein
MKVIIKSFDGTVLPFLSELDVPSEIDNPDTVELTYDFRIRKFHLQLIKLEWETSLDKYCVKTKALNSYRNNRDGYFQFEKALEIGIDVTKYADVETKISAAGDIGVRRIVHFKSTYKEPDKGKPFIEAAVKDLLNELHREEITFSRMVEKMNEVAIEWSHKK